MDIAKYMCVKTSYSLPVNYMTCAPRDITIFCFLDKNQITPTPETYYWIFAILNFRLDLSSLIFTPYQIDNLELYGAFKIDHLSDSMNCFRTSSKINFALLRCEL